MKLTSSRALCIVLILAGCFLLSAREFLSLPQNDVTVQVFDVGQGDSIFITGPSGQQILVDGGPDLGALEELGASMSFFDRTIDLLVLSHPHLDHLFAFPDILRRYTVRAVLLPGSVSNIGRYEEFLSLLKAKHIPVFLSDPEKDIDMGDGLILDLLWPTREYVHQSPDDLNNASVAFKLIYGNDSMLFTGDMEELEENLVLATGSDLSSDILKVAHHASKTSSSTGLLLAVNPSMAVASLAKDNSYGHPSPSIVKRFEALGIPLRLTMDEGTIELELDGL